MFKTGNIFIDQFSLALIFIPLLPVAIIFVRTIYQREVLLFLVILCLLHFIANLLIWIPKDNKIGLPAVQHIFSVLEMLVLLQIFKPALPGKGQDYLDIFRIAYLSSMITYYALQGLEHESLLITGLQETAVTALTALVLYQLLRTNQLYIFYLPLFWISVGTLFYFSIALLLETADLSYVKWSRALVADKMILGNIASLVRYFFYTLAALLYHASRTADRTSLL